MSAALESFIARSVHEAQQCPPALLPLPAGTPDGYKNEIPDEETLSFLTLWLIFTRQDKGESILEREFHYACLMSELNAPVVSFEAFEEFKGKSQTWYQDWSIHRNDMTRNDGIPAEDSFPWQDWPSLWPELVGIHDVDELAQLGGKSSDAGYFTHYEDVPVSTPLVRHFMLRMLQYSRRMTFGNKNGQKFNVWRQTRKMLMIDSIEYNFHKKVFGKSRIDLAYADLPWACLTPRHRCHVLWSLLRNAIRLSDTVRNKLSLAMDDPNYGYLYPNAPEPVKNYNPMTPLTEDKRGDKFWLLMPKDITEFTILKQDQEGKLAYFGSFLEQCSVKELFDKYNETVPPSNSVKEDEGEGEEKYALRNRAYPPKIEKLDFTIHQEIKAKERRRRNKGMSDATMARLGYDKVTYSRSGRPQRSNVIAAQNKKRQEVEVLELLPDLEEPPLPPPSRADRAANRIKTRQKSPAAPDSQDETELIEKRADTWKRSAIRLKSSLLTSEGEPAFNGEEAPIDHQDDLPVEDPPAAEDEYEPVAGAEEEEEEESSDDYRPKKRLREKKAAPPPRRTFKSSRLAAKEAARPRVVIEDSPSEYDSDEYSA